MNYQHTYSRLAFAVLASATAVTIGCNDGPTQTTGVPIVAPPPAPPPPPPPAPPPSTAPWFGFVGTEAEGFDAISAPAEAIGSYPAAINDASQVVGRVAYSGSDHAFIWTRADGMKDLGALPGGNWSIATAINSKGQVAGYSATSGGRWHAFRWSRESGMVDLGMLPGCVSASAFGINSDGDVVGQCLVNPSTARMRPFLWTESRGMEDLGTLSNHGDGGALAINDHGQVAGYSSPTSYYDEEWRAVLWTRVGDGARLDDCPSTGDGCSAWAKAINNRGDVVGNALGIAVMWMPEGRSSRVGDFGVGIFSSATAINDARQIVGYRFTPANGSLMSAFTWTEGLGGRVLAMLPGKTEMIATGINNKGEIIGYSR